MPQEAGVGVCSVTAIRSYCHFKAILIRPGDDGSEAEPHNNHRV